MKDLAAKKSIMDIQTYAEGIAKQAKKACPQLAVATAGEKNKLLERMAEDLVAACAELLAENAMDLDFARKSQLSEAMVDRLRLDNKAIEKMADGLRQVAKLPDPVGEVLSKWRRPNGIEIEKVRVPIGVVFMIFESRPNVTADAGALCLKSGNAVILRGGKEAIHSNVKIAQIMRGSCQACGFSPDVIQMVSRTEHEVVDHMLKMTEWIDLVIPRGGERLIRRVAQQSRIPVIKHYKGLCIVYVDNEADLSMAERIVVNSKTQRPGVCNAMETLLVHRDVAKRFLPRLARALAEKKVEIRACEESRKILPEARPATDEDFQTEYLNLTMSLKIVSDIQEAVRHIGRFGSHHSDAIVTKNPKTAEQFVREVDSSAVFVNASTRFNDGGEFGFGAEIGISTDKLHARGPMGLAELTSYKYIVRGSGQIRE
jgi:glutamate-5-semialdehyde dehydrogenase